MEAFLKGSAIMMAIGLLILVLIFWVKYKKPKRSHKESIKHTSNSNHENNDKHAKKSDDHNHESDHDHGHGKSSFFYKVLAWIFIVMFCLGVLWVFGWPPFNYPSKARIVLWEFILK